MVTFSAFALNKKFRCMAVRMCSVWCVSVTVRTPCSNSTKFLPWNWRRQFGVYTFCHSRAMCDFFLLLFGRRCCCVFFCVCSLTDRLYVFHGFFSRAYSRSSIFLHWFPILLLIIVYFSIIFSHILIFSVWFFRSCFLLGDDFIRICIHLAMFI